MHVICAECATSFVLDDLLVGARGVQVRCTACGQVFRVGEQGTVNPAAPWCVDGVDGRRHVYDSVSALLRAVAQGELLPEDRLRRGGSAARRLCDVAELAALFPAEVMAELEQQERERVPTLPGLSSEAVRHETAQARALLDRATHSGETAQALLDELSAQRAAQPEPVALTLPAEQQELAAGEGAVPAVASLVLSVPPPAVAAAEPPVHVLEPPPVARLANGGDATPIPSATAVLRAVASARAAPAVANAVAPSLRAVVASRPRRSTQEAEPARPRADAPAAPAVLDEPEPSSSPAAVSQGVVLTKPHRALRGGAVAVVALAAGLGLWAARPRPPSAVAASAPPVAVAVPERVPAALAPAASENAEVAQEAPAVPAGIEVGQEASAVPASAETAQEVPVPVVPARAEEAQVPAPRVAEAPRPAARAANDAANAEPGGAAGRSQQALERAVAKNPYDAAALFGLGQLAQQRGDRGAARRIFQQVVDVNPGYLPARLALADGAHADGRQAEARAAYQYIVGHYPESAYPERVKRRAGASTSAAGSASMEEKRE